jgi:hypothetical protein
LVFMKVFSWNIWAENTLRKLWKIKFDLQTFNCYI